MEKNLKKWQEVWEGKGGRGIRQNISLRDLIEIDGFDKSIKNSKMDVWFRMVELARVSLELNSNDYLFEVGCGAGAMLLPLSKYARKVAGIDYSPSMVEIIKRVIPHVEVYICGADSLPFPDRTFDKILANSVFQYFPDESYAEDVINEMQRTLKHGGRILLMDIPDIVKKIDSITVREKFIKYTQSDYTHLYYSKDFFEEIGNKYNLSFRIFNQEIEGYENSPFRFNVLYLDNKKY